MAFGGLEHDGGTPAPMSDINMTPLIDVMLVLVVILLITAPLMASSVRLELPHSDAATSTDAVATVNLALDGQGKAYLDNQPISDADLAAALARIALRDPSIEVQLRADQALAYGRVLAIMGLAQKAGLGRIGFVADPKEPAR
jgi:biopolymer transport protein TolR